jgi:copper ion binding protein
MIDRVFDVRGMHCQSCVGLVTDEVGDVDGVESVTVELANGRAVVRLDPDVASDADIVKAVREAGYEASPA